MKRLFVFAIMVMSLASLSAKEKIEKVKVRGEYTLLTTADITFKQAAAEALKDAKRKAIEKVCGETVNVWDRMSTSNVGESFNSLSLNQINGELVEYTVIKEWREDSKVRSVEVLFYCEIEAKVKKGLTPDPNFTADIEGVKGIYFEGDKIEFKVTPYRDAYLKIFCMENEQLGYRLYPNEIDGAVQKLTANEKHGILEYSDLECAKSTTQKVEVNYLVFVFTKEEYPFYKDVNSWQEIETWMAKIPSDQKYIYYAPIEIREKQ